MENNVFREMNIETLMPSHNHNYNRNKGILTVDMISSGSKINVEPDRDFDSTQLLNNIVERRRKKRNWLVEMYNKCCVQIKEADGFGLTDIIFTLPEIIVENSSYKHIEAIEYVSKNLRLQKLDTYIIDNRSLFVTWKYIELNLNIDSI
jgi:hypothetical protein